MKHYFYDKPIFPRHEQAHIEKILHKYRNDKVDDTLKQKIWDDLIREKHKGHISIPFKVITRYDPSGKFPERIEIILDTKV